MSALTTAISRKDGDEAARQFAVGPDLRWEVYEHFDPPNGTKGALRSHDDVSEFVGALDQTWMVTDLVPPLPASGPPVTAVYGAGFSIAVGDRERADGAKVVIDCASGLISHMVGPNSG